MFRTQGLIFRKTVVISTGTVKCMVHPGASKCGCAGITIKGVNKIYRYTVFKFKYNDKYIYIYINRYLILIFL